MTTTPSLTSLEEQVKELSEALEVAKVVLKAHAPHCKVAIGLIEAALAKVQHKEGGEG